MNKAVSGFSKLSKEDKINWVSKNQFIFYQKSAVILFLKVT